MCRGIYCPPTKVEERVAGVAGWKVMFTKAEGVEKRVQCRFVRCVAREWVWCGVRG